MKLLAIVTSPKKGRNTDTLVDDVLQGVLSVDVGEKVDVDKIYFNPLNVRPCQDCGYCRKNEACSIKDDMQDIYPLIEEADGIILGAPTYYWGMNAQAKIFIDRCFCFIEMVEKGDDAWSFQSRIKKPKKLIFAGTDGSDGTACFKGQEEVIDYLCNDINATHYDHIYGSNTDFCPVKDNDALRQRARALGARWVRDIKADLLKN